MHWYNSRNKNLGRVIILGLIIHLGSSKRDAGIVVDINLKRYLLDRCIKQSSLLVKVETSISFDKF